MKTFQCKKSLLAVGLAVGMASTGALALSGLDSDTFDVKATVLGVVDVANVSSLNFGDIDPSGTGDITPAAPMGFCIYSSTGSAKVSVSSAGGVANGDNTVGLLTGPDTLAYTLKYKDNVASAYSDFPWVGTGTATLSDNHGVIDTPCGPSSVAVKISGTILSADYAGKPAGSYSDTVTIDVTPV